MDQQDHFAAHGGVHFQNLAPPEQINRFVRELPADRRESLFEVLKTLEQEGLIKIMNDGVWTDGEGKIGGSDNC